MKRVIRFLRRYKLFGLACYALVAGLALQALGQKAASHWLLSVVSILAVLPILWEMIQDVRAGKYGIDILAITAVIGSVLLGQYWVAIVIVLMVTLGESLQDFARHRAQNELGTLLDGVPRVATVLRKGKPVQVRASELKTSDKILIKAGELVPADAIIIEGTADFDESLLTGEGLPVRKTAGDSLLCASLNQNGEIIAKVTASAAASQYQQIIKFVRSTSKAQAPFVRLTERFVLPFTVTAFAVAAAVWVVSGQAIRGLEVIIVATPGPLLLAAPIALISGMTRASRFGIIVKTGSALELLADAETIAFNKTGTLTHGQFAVDNVLTFGSTSHVEVIKLAGSLEQSSKHVVSLAIVAYAKAKNIKLIKAKHVREISGRGLQAILQGKAVIVGRFSLMEENGITLPKTFKPASVKQTAVYVALNGELVGIIVLRDAVRDEAGATIKRLHNLGLRESLLVTGDNQQIAQTVAKQLGINHIHAGTLPASKLHVLSEVKKRPLVFVGDGAKDAAVLTAADIGIALGARGSTIAGEPADMVILPADLGRVASAYAIARRTFKIARQSILAGISLSIILMLVFATGKFPPLAGAILQEAVDALVIFNALRAHLTPRTSS